MMPWTCGVSGRTTVWRILRSPRLRSTIRCRSGVPMTLRTRVMDNWRGAAFLGIYLSCLLHRTEPDSCHHLWIPELGQPFEGCAYGIEWVSTPQRLCDNVMGAGQFHHGPYRTTRDDAGSGAGRLQQDVFPAEHAMDFMWDGLVFQRDPYE